MRVIELEAEVLSDIKGDMFPVANFDSATKQTIYEILSRPPGVVTLPERTNVQLPFNGSYHHMQVGEKGYRLRQSGPDHRRSFVIEHPDLPPEITDEYGNVFSSFTIKGGNFASPGLLHTATAQHELIAFGLQEAYASRRILRASDILRKHGVGTEYIMAMSEPLWLPYPDPEKQTDEYELIGRNAYTRRIINSHWQELGDEDRTFEKLAELRKNHSRTAYMLTFRGMDTEYRLSELTRDEDMFRKVLEDIGLDPDMSPNAYLKEYFIPALAINLAKMHSAGLCHRFLVPINVSARGSIIDLDGVQGEPLGLGDDPITAGNMAYDLTYFIKEAYTSILLSTNEQSAKELCLELFTIYMNTMTELNEHNPELIGRLAVVISKQVQAINDPFSVMYKDSLANMWQEMIVQYLDASILEINREIEEFLDDQQIDALAATLNSVLKGKMHELADHLSIDLFNEHYDDVKNGNIQKAIYELFEKYGIYKQSIMELIRPEIILLIEEALGSQHAFTVEKMQAHILSDKVAIIADRLIENHGEELIKGLCDYLTNACLPASELLGPGQLILTVGPDGKLVYVSEEVSTSILQQIVGDKNLDVAIRRFNDIGKRVDIDKDGLLRLKEGVSMFFGESYNVREIVFFTNDGAPINSWGYDHDNVLEIDLKQPDSGVFLVAGDNPSGKRQYIVVVNGESMEKNFQKLRDEGVLSDESFFASPNQVQTAFFDESEYAGTPIRLKDYFGNKPKR